MTFAERLAAACIERRSHVCVGLDPQPELMPAGVSVVEFNRAIVDATIDVAPVYKPNLAFYEALGLDGWKALKSTIEHIGGRAIVLGDAKRGDMGPTAVAYAKAMFDVLGLGACTVNPYLGVDGVAPFLAYRDRGSFVLCRTSNPSAADLQDGLYRRVAELARGWNEHGNVGLVAGATRPHELSEIRALAPGLPFLLPGAGAQGGDAAGSARAVRGGPFVINSSRGIIYASTGPDFADAARGAAIALRDEIAAAVA